MSPVSICCLEFCFVREQQRLFYEWINTVEVQWCIHVDANNYRRYLQSLWLQLLDLWKLQFASVCLCLEFKVALTPDWNVLVFEGVTNTFSTYMKKLHSTFIHRHFMKCLTDMPKEARLLRLFSWQENKIKKNISGIVKKIKHTV